MKKSLLIIDGLNYLFRAYFGIPDAIKTKKGTSINAVYGFFSFMRKTIESVNPDCILVVFDSENAGKTKQNDYQDYKANRPESYDPGMFFQLRIIKNILQLMDIKFIEEDNIEADDLIGSYCDYASSSNTHSVFVSSNDFDFIQLISNNTSILRNYKGQQHIINESEASKLFGIFPKSYVDYASLIGDKSDNIKGVKGIGKKIASDLISKYSSIENILKNKNEIKEGIRKKIENNLDLISRNKKIITINCSVVDDFIPLDDLQYNLGKVMLKTNFYLEKLDL